ncbi:MAG: nucleotidyltransferase, partial [Clostridia bacterium]|nr:nucleotidyltransferase [Clostridia bacterium]
MDLVIMAAGMGSRFGGLKQIEPIDEYGNFIIDYSIFDAIRFGFDRVVFIIKEENYDIFRSTVGKRIENRIKVEYVFQKGLSVNPTRVKPWGTA